MHSTTAAAADARSIRKDALSPTEVRLRVVDEHHRLRILLTALQALAREVTLDATRDGALRSGLRTLIVEFALHLDSEEEMLLPLVSKVDAWGAERAARMREEHRVQRALLRRMFRRLEERTLTPSDLALEVDGLVLRIFHDMRDEEAELLDEGLLHDDAVVVDQICG